MILAGAVAQRRYAPRSDWWQGGSSDRESADSWLQRLISGPPEYDDPPVPEGIEPFYDNEDWYRPHRILKSRNPRHLSR